MAKRRVCIAFCPACRKESEINGRFRYYALPTLKDGETWDYHATFDGEEVRFVHVQPSKAQRCVCGAMKSRQVLAYVAAKPHLSTTAERYRERLSVPGGVLETPKHLL
jgi:hypothetical protein